jgi:Protein of unknown function (DUF3467)
MSDSPKPEAKPQQLQIQLPPELAGGTYANLTLVNHTETEVVLDFIFVQPLEPRAQVRSRIISSPKHAKRLLMALSDNLARYEQRYGAIDSGPDAKPVH